MAEDKAKPGNLPELLERIGTDTDWLREKLRAKGLKPSDIEAIYIDSAYFKTDVVGRSKFTEENFHVIANILERELQKYSLPKIWEPIVYAKDWIIYALRC